MNWRLFVIKDQTLDELERERANKNVFKDKFSTRETNNNATKLNETVSLSRPNPTSANWLVTEEELFIVLVVLCAWIFVICLFFKKWGKIRMLEPYHPEYHQEPSPSATTGTGTTGNYKDRYRLNISDMPACFSATSMPPERAVHLSDIALPLLMHARPRINSMFVYSQKHREAMASWNVSPNARKVRSAEDINMVVVHQVNNDE